MNGIQFLDHHDPAKGIWVINNPNAPSIKNPNRVEQANLQGYWMSILRNADLLQIEQGYNPGWMPPFNIINI